MGHDAKTIGDSNVQLLVSLKNDSHNFFVEPDVTDIKKQVRRMAVKRKFQV